MIKKTWKTRDAVFQFRMGAGFSGDLNRTHPASIVAEMQDATNPALNYGIALILNTTPAIPTVRQAIASDTTNINIYGVAVRPYPVQQPTSPTANAPAAFGAAVPSTVQMIDVLKAGYILVAIPTGQTPKKGSPVYVWSAASSAPHVQGGFEGTTPGGSGFQALNCTFNGSPDANGVVEIVVGTSI